MRQSKLTFVAAVLALGCGTPTTPGTTTIEHTFPARDFACPASDTSPACATTEPALPEAARTVDVAQTFPDTTLAFVVSDISLPRGTSRPEPMAAGFNLDGLDVREAGDGSDCGERSVDVASLSETGVEGVDNALEAFVPTVERILTDCPGGETEGCLDSTLDAQIASGALVLLVEVSGVNDYRYDDAVSVQVMLGERVGGEAPTLGADGRLVADQDYVPAESPTGTPLLLGPAYQGDVFAGRLRIHTDELALSIQTGERLLEITLRNADLRFDLSATSLTDGMIGGALPGTDIVAAAAMVAPDAAGLVQVAVDSAADIDPTADPSVCGSVSVGITFEATAAHLTR